MDKEQGASQQNGMSTLSEVMNIAGTRGYTAELSITNKGLCVAGKDQYFKPEEIHIDNFYRFEGASNPEDTSILYLIETSDGTKGTLVDAYGAYADSRITEFIKAVEVIQKSCGPET